MVTRLSAVHDLEYLTLHNNTTIRSEAASTAAACRHEALCSASDEARMLEIVLDMYQDKTLPGAQEAIVQDGVSHISLCLLGVRRPYVRRIHMPTHVTSILCVLLYYYNIATASSTF